MRHLFRRHSWFWGISLFGALLWSSLVSVRAQRRPAANEASVVIIKLSAQPASGGYAGEESCRSCHKSELTEFHKTVHAAVTNAGATQRMDCETCHGPGKAHVDGEESAHGDDAASAVASRLIFAFKGTPSANTAPCLACHAPAAQLQRFDHSRHAATGVACQSCHTTHLVDAADPSAPQRPGLAQAAFFQVPALALEQRWLRESLLKDSQPALCYSCHQDVRVKFAQPFHHRVPEGSMKCTDCHSPHGTANRASLTAPAWETCTACHTDKRGPFVFEHAAVRVEGCAVCHTPHGSVSRFLLVRRESRFLCLQCHGDPHSAQASVPHSRLSFQTRDDCTRCHAAIHGSNFDVDFLQ